MVVKNGGDLRVGPGVELAFYGSWGGTEEALAAGGNPLVVTLDKSLEPGASTLVTVTYDVGNNGPRTTSCAAGHHSRHDRRR